MSSASRVWLFHLALSLSLVNFSLAQPRSSSSIPTSPPSSDESAVRAVVEKYFVLYSAEDLDGLISLWSVKSPDYASLKQNLQRQFAIEDFSFSEPLISRAKVEREKADLRAMTNLTAINRKSNQKREQRVSRNFAFVMEEGQWKVWRSAPAEDDLAEALVKAKTEAEWERLISEEKDLVTAELVQALGNRGDRIYNQGSYAQALSIYTQTLSIAEQLGDQRAIVNTLNDIGNVNSSKGNYALALDFYRKSLKLSEALGDKSGIATTLGNLASIYEKQGNHAQALDFADRASALARQIGETEALWKLRLTAGEAYSSLGQLPQARQAFEEAINSVESLRAQVAGGEQEQQRFFESKVSPIMLWLTCSSPRPVGLKPSR